MKKNEMNKAIDKYIQTRTGHLEEEVKRLREKLKTPRTIWRRGYELPILEIDIESLDPKRINELYEQRIRFDVIDKETDEIVIPAQKKINRKLIKDLDIRIKARKQKAK